MALSPSSLVKFDVTRASEYAVQSRIALAGYEACHELSSCLLAASIGRGASANILVAGGGGNAMEIMTGAAIEPLWRFLAVDPSRPMLDMCMEQAASAGLADRVTCQLGYICDLPTSVRFDAATLIGVLHHVSGEAEKRLLLQNIAARLKPAAPLILACNRRHYATRPLFLKAWEERWRSHGASAEVARTKLDMIVDAADPPADDETVSKLLTDAGFEPPLQFFSSLFWGAWISSRSALSPVRDSWVPTTAPVPNLPAHLAM